jgi:hypothetical protein
MVGDLAQHQSSSARALGSISCGGLVKLLRLVTEGQAKPEMNVSSSRDVHSDVIYSAAYAFSGVAQLPNGVQAVV